MTIAICILLFFIAVFTFLGWVVHVESKQAIALKSKCEHTYELLERVEVKSAFGSYVEAYKYVNKCTKCGELDVTEVNIQ
jgi:hypothetical protein